MVLSSIFCLLTLGVTLILPGISVLADNQTTSLRPLEEAVIIDEGPMDYHQLIGPGNLTLEKVLIIDVGPMEYQLTVPENLTFEETLLFWDTLVCPDKSVCDAGKDIQHLTRCSSIKCQGCSCDNCDKGKDCCVDKYLNITNKTPYMSCRFATPQNAEDETDSYSYYLVDKCPKNFTNSDIKAACENPHPLLQSKKEVDTNMPVYNPTSDVNYLNSFCAQCHSDAEELLFWEVEMRCFQPVDVNGVNSKEEMFLRVLNDPNCLIIGTPVPGSGPERCSAENYPVSSCSQTYEDEDIKRACALYKNIIITDHGEFRNIFCAFCNGISRSWVKDIFSKPDECYPPFDRPRTEIASFSVLFKFTDMSSERETSKAADDLRECPGNMLYHQNLKKCRALVCSKGRFVNNHTCEDAFERVDGVGYSLVLYLIPPVNQSQFIDSRAIRSFIYDFFAEFGWKYLKITMNLCSTVQNESDKLPSWIKLSIQIAIGCCRRPEEFERALLDLYNSAFEFSDITWAVEHRPPNNPTAHRIMCITKVYTSLSSLFALPVEYRTNPDAFITVNRLIRCNQLELDATEYSIDNDTGHIELSWSREILGPSDFHVVNDSVRICVNYSGWYQIEHQTDPLKDDGSDEVEVMLTMVCVGLSVSALVATFIICVLTRAQRRIPGLIIMTLITLILLAQLLFLVSGYAKDDIWVCRIIGMTVHYVWLSVFAWKNVAAYHMHAIFTNPLKHIHDSHSKSLLKYSLYGFGFPALIVGSYVSARVVLSRNSSIGYGGEGTCFLTSPKDVGLAFALPIGLVLLSNMYFFGRVIHAIRQMSEIDKHTNKVNASHNALFMKMSVILGFTWIVGFIANIISQPFAWYIFIILNGGIGVLVFVSQACNRNVASHLCRCFKDWTSQGSTDNIDIPHQ